MSAKAFEVWRGCVNAWECDEMGHLNVRHYLAKWLEGMGATAATVGATAAFRANATATLAPVDQHVRFHAEARAGAPLSMTALVVEVEEMHATFCHQMVHGDGRLAATFLTKVAHVDAARRDPFAWTKRMRERLMALRGPIPAAAKPRSIDLKAPPGDVSAARAQALGVAPIGRGMIGAPDADAFGRARADFFIGRISDSVPNLLSAWRAEAGREAAVDSGKTHEAGAAVVEFRLIYRAWPAIGELFEVRSAVVEVAEKTQRLIHWMLDPVSGQPWFSGEAVALTFDLKTRKTITPSPALRAALQARIVPGFSL